MALMHMIKQRPLMVEEGDEDLTVAALFSSWPLHPPTDEGNGPHIVSTRKGTTDFSGPWGTTTPENRRDKATHKRP